MSRPFVRRFHYDISDDSPIWQRDPHAVFAALTTLRFAFTLFGWRAPFSPRGRSPVHR